jgi:cytoskeleton protein RodZ
MKQTGQLLRETREKKGVTLNEVAMATKINVKVLESMENGDVEGLPSKAFLRGFVQTYSNYLKLDSKKVLTSFNEEMGFNDTKPKPVEPIDPLAPEPTPAPAPSAAATPSPTKTSIPRPIEDSSSSMMQRIFIGVGVLAVILIIKLLFTTIEKYERESKTPTPSEIESTIKEQTLKHEQTPEPAPPTPEPEPAKPTPPPTPAKPVAATPPPAPPPAPAPAPKADPVPASPNAKKALLSETGASIQNKELIIEALDNVEIVFSIDGGPAKRTRLDTDKIHIIKAENSISVEVSDGGAINVIFNGQDLGVPGTVGKPMKLNYP